MRESGEELGKGLELGREGLWGTQSTPQNLGMQVPKESGEVREEEDAEGGDGGRTRCGDGQSGASTGAWAGGRCLLEALERRREGLGLILL